ncbi:MAG: class I SAM-dependent methyltransferase [Acidimicrobiales bacterium]
MDQREYQRRHYDHHYPRHAAAVRQQLAHPLFRSWNDRLAAKVLDQAPPGPAPAGAGRPLCLYEVACGEGLLASALARVAAERGVTLAYSGTDLSPAGLEVARSAVAGDFVAGDAVEVTAGMAAGSADVVVIKNLLHHLDDPAALLREAARVAGPEGRVVIVEARAANLAFFLSTFIFAYRRERYFFRGRRRNLTGPVAAAGLRVVHAEVWSWLPFELFLAIRVDWFRRLLSSGEPATLARINGLDEWLTRAVPGGACYDLWSVAAASRS